VARVNHWAGASGKYFRSRAQAQVHIAAAKPALGIMSLGAFLALRGKLGLKVIGTASVDTAGGRRYHLVSKTGKTLDDCKGKAVASDHFSDKRFVERVVAGGDFTLADFTVVQTRRPIQTIKKVTRDQAACALIDDAQFKDLKSVEGGAALKSVWKSKHLPPMVVVSFRGADTKVARSFKSKLGLVCAGAGRRACGDVGIKALLPSGEAPYRAEIKAYGP
jgi:hypothetical protein